MAKHIHADLMMEYAKLAQKTERPWEYFQYRIHGNEEWRDGEDSFAFSHRREYRLKPKTIRIGEYDIPEPVREPLENGTEYYYVSTGQLSYINWASMAGWSGRAIDIMRLDFGIIHLDRESAELHAKALISLTQKKE
ncbi:hypothetical protein [Xenorhabdus lircayensis]|uniref:Uncharacterized protein n=1 Tax=Xenorhabdus lircayensis TaxID=2763499 RepID=A0ABS0UA15_9GAMM|nr:hypothetical protein [Xenorhabdus lircayensis]MBI6550700.1 hypothetical protein [Xenorhabdus lircayensis]